MNDFKPKRATLHDVARIANVSYQTVSRVINNSPNVASETRNRVVRAMRELDYRPNRAAQMLSTHRSNVLELITLDIWGVSADVISNMASAAKALGYQITISATTLEDFESLALSTPARLVDGVVLAAQHLPHDDDKLNDLLQGTPFVKIKGDIGTRIATVSYDQHHGARLAVRHLIDLGHRGIATISGAMELYDGYARHESWLSTLHEAGLQPGPSAAGSFTAQGGYQAMKQLLDGGQSFTAVFAANDESALGAYYALWERGLRVPDDYSIVGFDDAQGARFYTPPLTTVRQDNGLIGRLAVEHLVSFIEHPDNTVYQRVIKPELVVRASTRRLESRS